MNSALKSALRPAANVARRFIKESVGAKPDDRESQHQQAQRSIVNQYKLFKAQNIVPYTNISEAGFRVYSQFEEDGIILYVLAMIGFKTKRVVEMCCGTGDVCMATNLILNHGFDGFLFDGDEQNVSAANTFFASKPDCWLYRPEVRQSWITTDNVNKLLIDIGCAGEVDLFSLDIDGNDYWVMKKLEAINPRLIVVETQNVAPAGRSIAHPYEPSFDYHSNEPEPKISGAHRCLPL